MNTKKTDTIDPTSFTIDAASFDPTSFSLHDWTCWTAYTLYAALSLAGWPEVLDRAEKVEVEARETWDRLKEADAVWKKADLAKNQAASAVAEARAVKKRTQANKAFAQAWERADKAREMVDQAGEALAKDWARANLAWAKALAQTASEWVEASAEVEAAFAQLELVDGRLPQLPSEQAWAALDGANRDLHVAKSRADKALAAVQATCLTWTTVQEARARQAREWVKQDAAAVPTA